MKQAVEFVLYQMVRGVVKVLPERWAFSCMERLVWFVHQTCGWRREETAARIQQVFPGKGPDEVHGLRKEAVFNLGRTFTELLRMPPDFGERIYGKEETFAAFRTAREQGRGVLLVIAHSGNWDLAGVATAEEGFPMCFIARKQKNNRIYEDLVQAREKGGGTVIDRDDPRLIRKVLGLLAENYIVAILVDIRARKPGEPWSFLGQEAWVSNGLGLLAAKSGAAVVPVYLGRAGRYRHLWKPFASVRLESGSSREERDHLLQRCLTDLGGEILLNPESYFWFNKRWVLEKKTPDV